MNAEQLLRNYGACVPSKLYAYGKKKRAAWFNCEDPRWLIWLVTQVLGVKRALAVVLEIVKIYCLKNGGDALKTAIKYVEEQRLGTVQHDPNHILYAVNSVPYNGLLTFVCRALLEDLTDKSSVASLLHDRVAIFKCNHCISNENLCGIIRALVPYDEILKNADPNGNPEE